MRTTCLYFDDYSQCWRISEPLTESNVSNLYYLSRTEVILDGRIFIISS